MTVSPSITGCSKSSTNSTLFVRPEISRMVSEVPVKTSMRLAWRPAMPLGASGNVTIWFSATPMAIM